MQTPAKNNVLSRLQGGISSSDTALIVLDGSAFPIKGWAVIGQGSGTIDPTLNEVIYYERTGNTLGLLQRGQDGTTARAWAAGDYVGITVIARHIAELQVTYGTTLERTALGGVLSNEDVFRKFFDTTLGELFVWDGAQWAVPVLSIGAQRGVVDYVVSSPAELSAVLASNYRKGDRLTDLTTVACRVSVCRADLITHSISDWIAIGKQL